MASVLPKWGLPPTENVHGGTKIHNLFKGLRNMLKLSAESMKEVRNGEKLIKKSKYLEFEEKYTCEAFAGIEIRHYEEFIEELKDKFDWDDGTKESLLDILKMDGGQIHKRVVKFEMGGVEIQYSQIGAEKNGEKINLAIAKYEFIYFWQDPMSQMTMSSFFKAATSESFDEIAPTMTEEHKNMLRLWSQNKLFIYVDEKCKSAEE